MPVIYKYQFEISELFYLELPSVRQILAVQLQHGTPTMWVLVNPDYVKENVLFRTLATGEQSKYSPGKYISTIQLDGFVWHIFEDSL